MFNLTETKYRVQYTNRFKKEYKKVLKQGKDESLFLETLSFIANGEDLPFKYRNHQLVNSKTFKDCFECHIEPDWLLVYKIQDDCLVLLLFATGEYAELFKK